ncbi:MAG: dihydrodipicolinate reductase [Acidimicrobiia bacterium]|nr:dihydrodipicolinate reductase [Acidimicrobiia bacterium]
MKLLIVGYGRMGRLVEELARADGIEVAGRVDVDNADGDWPAADVAVDFSIASAVPHTLTRLAATKTAVVIGTTGWRSEEAAMRRLAGEAGIGVVAAPNFSIGVNVFGLLVAEAARLMAAQPGFGAWLHEAHHAAKVDAPSGTALTLLDAMRAAGFDRSIDVSSTRAGMIPGTHTVGFDSSADTIELIHRARDRSGFARGALVAARWIVGRCGWYSMQDVLRAGPGREP